MVRIYYYAADIPKLSQITAWVSTWNTPCGAATGRVIWFTRTAQAARTRLMLKTFSDQDQRPRDTVMDLRDCGVADTFPTFAEQLAADGFAFLAQRLQTGLIDGPILVTVEDRRIVGAIGPLTILLDATRTPTQPPQYFAVHPDYRHCGHGRTLWRAAMAWGAPNGAEYKVLQVATGSAAEQLYLSEGLSTLGFLATSKDLPIP